MIRKYEIMYILSPKLDKNDINKITANINSIFTKEGKILVSEIKSELKTLAYPIQKLDRGFYNNLVVEANPETINEFNRVANITEEIIRFIILKKEDK